MFYRLPVLSERLFDVQMEGEHFMSIAMYNKHVTLHTHKHTHTHTHTVYPRSAMEKWAFDLPCDTNFACITSTVQKHPYARPINTKGLSLMKI
jgi:hypothetical protein